MSTNIVRLCSKNVYIDSSFPNTNHQGYYGLFCGTYQNYTIYRFLLEFNLESYKHTMPCDFLIQKAEIVLHLMRNDYTGYEKTYNIYRITEEFNESEVTYNTEPSIEPVPYASFCLTDEFNTQINIDITDLFLCWYDEQLPNYGILIKSTDESTNSLICFYSNDCGNRTYCPHLNIYLKNPVSISERQTLKYSELNLVTHNSYIDSKIYNVSQLINYTWFIKNNGNLHDACIKSCISPNQNDWIDDSESITIAPGETISIVPRIYSEFAKILYKSNTENNSTNIDIILIGQK